MFTLLSLVILSSLSPFAKPFASVYPFLFPFWHLFPSLSCPQKCNPPITSSREEKLLKWRLGGNETEEEMKQTETHTHTQGEIKV